MAARKSSSGGSDPKPKRAAATKKAVPVRKRPAAKDPAGSGKKADEAMRILARFPSEDPSPVVRIRADEKTIRELKGRLKDTRS